MFERIQLNFRQKNGKGRVASLIAGNGCIQQAGCVHLCRCKSTDWSMVMVLPISREIQLRDSKAML